MPVSPQAPSPVPPAPGPAPCPRPAKRRWSTSRLLSQAASVAYNAAEKKKITLQASAQTQPGLQCLRHSSQPEFGTDTWAQVRSRLITLRPSSLLSTLSCRHQTLCQVEDSLREPWSHFSQRGSSATALKIRAACCPGKGHLPHGAIHAMRYDPLFSACQVLKSGSCRGSGGN